MLQNIILTIIAIILSVIGYFLKDAPIFIRELKVEKFRNENQSNLQVESYFREISGKDLQQTFKSWLTLCFARLSYTILQRKSTHLCA